MKIHKLNLENYYRNAIDSAIAVLSNLPEAVFAGRPTYNNALLRFNDGETPVLMLPKWSDIEIDLSQHKPAWAPASLTGTIKVSITPSVVGVEASADETSLGSFDVYGVTGTSTGKQYEVTEGKYAIEYAMSILDGEDNPVVVFSNGQAFKVSLVKDADNGPDTTLDIPAGGGGSFTQEQADWNQSDDTKANYIKNKPSIPAAQVNADWDATEGVAQILNKPTIPTVNNATLTLKQGTTTLGTFTANASTDVEVTIPAGGGGDLLVEKTWSELKAMRDGGTLVPGQQYRITDYVATTITANTSSAGNVFDILVVADDASHLNEQARAINHAGDTYFSNCKLNAWQLWYCLDNDTTRFDWADSTNGKGVIYRMIDEWKNDLPYDFKGIKLMFGNYSVGNSTTDRSLNGTCHDNKCGRKVSGNKYSIPISTSFGYGAYNNTVGTNSNCSIGYQSCDNVVGNDCTNIQIENQGTNTWQKGNVIGNNCDSIRIGMGSCYNRFGEGCKWDTIKNYSENNVFEPDVLAVVFSSNYFKNIKIRAGVKNVNLTASSTTSSSAYYQNVTLEAGLIYDSPVTITDANVGQAYATIFFKETDGTLKKQEGTTITTVA